MNNDDTDSKLHIADVSADDEEVAKTDPEDVDQQGYLGSEPNPELVTAKDTLEEAQEMGLYPDASDEYPVPVGEHQLTE